MHDIETGGSSQLDKSFHDDPNYDTTTSRHHTTPPQSHGLTDSQSLRTRPSMSLDPPTYLSSLQNNIRARPIPWDGAVRAGTITEEQLSKIRAVDKVRKEQRKSAIEADLDGYRTLFVGGEGKQSILEAAVKRADVVQYVLVLLGDLINGEPPRLCSRCAIGWPDWLAQLAGLHPTLQFASLIIARHIITTQDAP